MNYRVSIALLVILLAGMAVIVIVGDAPAPDTGPTGLWPDFAAADVSEVAWVSRQGEVRVRRSPLDDGGWEVFADGAWAPAEGGPVEEVLVDLDRLEILKLLDGDTVDAQSRKDWGMLQPTHWIRFRLRDEEITLRFGSPTIGRDSMYAGLEGSEDVYVLSDDLKETVMPLTTDSLRRRQVFEWNVSDVDRFEVRRGGKLVLAAQRRDDDRFIWYAEVPFRGYLKTEAVETDFLGTVLGMKVTDFVAADPDVTELPRYGLVEPAWRVTLRKGAGEDVTRTIEIGGPVPDDPDRYYFRVSSQPFVYAAKRRALFTRLEADPATLRDRNLTRLGYWPLGRVRGEYGEVVFRLDKQAGVWSVSEPEGMTADAAAVEAWFETVRGLSVLEFVDEPDFTALGLDEPSGRLTFWLPPTPDQDEGDVAVSLHLGKQTDAGIYVRRVGQEDVAFLAGKELIRLLTPGAWQFRARTVFTDRRYDATKIVRRGVAGDDASEFRDEAWTGGASADRVNGIVQYLLALTATRWVGPAEGEEESYGLGAGSIEVTFGTGEEAAVFGLILGRETEGGRYARAVREGVPGEAVFVLDPASERLLTAPFPPPEEPAEKEGE